MASSTFISWICHFWARFWLNFNFGDFRAYFSHFSLVKIDFFKIHFHPSKIFFGKNKNYPQFLYHINQWKNTGPFDFGTFFYFQPYLLLVDFPRLRYPLPAPLPVQSRNLASSAFCNLPEIDRICSSSNIQFKGNRFRFPWFENTDARTRFASVMKWLTIFSFKNVNLLEKTKVKYEKRKKNTLICEEKKKDEYHLALPWTDTS